jgi:hypothetical protein
MYVSEDTVTIKEMNMVIYEFDHGKKKTFDTDDENLLSAYENTFYVTCGYDRSWDRLMPVVLKLMGQSDFFLHHSDYIGYRSDFDYEAAIATDTIVSGYGYNNDPLKAVYYAVYESIKKTQ